MTLDAKSRAELQALAEKATPGEWTVIEDPRGRLVHVESAHDAKQPGMPVCSIPTKRSTDADLIVAAVNLLPALLDAADRLAEVERERDSARHALEFDRARVITATNEFHDQLKGRTWLLEGRGPYSWDDDRYRDEFADALKAIEKPIEALRKIGKDWTDCPKTHDEIMRARTDFEARAAAAEALLDRMAEGLAPFADVAKVDIGEDESDIDWFEPMTRLNRAPRLRVGSLRRAASILAEHRAMKEKRT